MFIWLGNSVWEAMMVKGRSLWMSMRCGFSGNFGCFGGLGKWLCGRSNFLGDGIFGD